MKTNNSSDLPRSSGRGDYRPGRSAQSPQNGFDDPLPEEITLAWLFRRLFAGLKLVWIALRYRIHKMSGGSKLAGIRVSWIKLGFVGLAVFMVTQKDIRFSINLRAPLAGDRNQVEKAEARSTALDKLSIGDALPFGAFSNRADPVVSVEDLDAIEVNTYIRRFSKVAVAEMRKFGIPASIKLGQAIVESNAGTSVGAQSNNHFGQPLSDEEYVSAWENWRAHSLYLKREFADLSDSAFGYKQWAKGLAKKGYNTDRKYADKLIQVIEQYQLDRFDE